MITGKTYSDMMALFFLPLRFTPHSSSPFMAFLVFLRSFPVLQFVSFHKNSFCFPASLLPMMLFSSSPAQVRHLVLAVSTVCLMLIFSNSILLNFTIICMSPPAGADDSASAAADKGANSTSASSEAATFSPFQRSALFSATAVGAILGSLPINQLVGRYSLRHTITGYGLLSALATLATPLGFFHFGFCSLLIARILQGTSYPAECITNSWVTRKWATAGSTGTFLMLISSHFQLGPMLTMPAAGHFCESSLGWQGIYYLQGLLTLAFFGLFYAIFRDCPSKHPWISETELKLIQMGKQHEEDEDGTSLKRKAVPYRAILADWAVWLLLLAFFSDEIGFQLYTQLGPYYLNKVLGIGVAGTGLFSALLYLVSMLSKMLSGPIDDRLLNGRLSESARIKLFTAISQYGIALSFVCLALLPLLSHSLWLTLPFYACLNMFTGLDFLGVFRCAQTMALRHSELVIAWASILSSSIALVLPSIVWATAPDDSMEQWMRVLATIGLIVALCVSTFLALGKTRPRKWALEEEHSEQFGEEKRQKY